MSLFLKPLALVFAIMAALPASASTYTINYFGFQGQTLFVEITTQDVLNSRGGYNIIGANGSLIDPVLSVADTITGIVENPNAPQNFITPDGVFGYENAFFTNDANGLTDMLLTGAGSGRYNLFARGDGFYTLALAPVSAIIGTSFGSAQTARLPDVKPVSPPVIPTAVPEPMTWFMMIVGFVVIGLTIRRGKKPTAHLAFAV